MKFLLTNDDGVDAAGLQALCDAAAQLGAVSVLAPHEHVSGCGHRVTTHRPLRIAEVRPGWRALDGSPADCARVALTQLDGDCDWVLAGVNEGGNLGADLYGSGTVAAAREACLLGKRAIAISQYRRGPHIDWRRTTEWTRSVLAHLFGQSLAPLEFWNVNLPDPQLGVAMPQIVHCEMDPHPLPVEYELRDGALHYRGVYRERLCRPGCDVDVCFRGQIALTRIRLG